RTAPPAPLQPRPLARPDARARPHGRARRLLLAQPSGADHRLPRLALRAGAAPGRPGGRGPRAPALRPLPPRPRQPVAPPRARAPGAHAAGPRRAVGGGDRLLPRPARPARALRALAAGRDLVRPADPTARRQRQ